MRITFALDWTTDGGRKYLGGESYDVNDNDARSLIHRGYARPAPEETPEAETPAEEPAKSGGTKKAKEG